jgi:hypothetical protein
MPRYLVQRNFGTIDDESLQIGYAKSTDLVDNVFPDVFWEHTHVVTDPDGTVRTFCIYAAPSEALVYEHSQALGGHVIEAIYEIGGDVKPDDYRH